ncbi:hypothetical protein N805_03790 [Pseudomonas putida S13.1.2]|uniref:Uncharacterized protein n=1 Tax=Pseudomonas putida S13.1.2 TaxID=1384061 RepID=A0AAU8RS49_PSEPU|nr:hypothetical protein N805_03790 [Pseudomonas putida S13.1.2]
MKRFVALFPKLKKNIFCFFGRIKQARRDRDTLHYMINLDRELFCANRADHAALSPTTDVDEPVSLQFCNDFNYMDHL